MKEQILKTISVISVSALTIVGISYAQAWTGNTSTAPANNTPAPINVGSSSQIKSGSLSLTGLDVSGGVIFGLNAGAGKVLTSDSVGNATWQTAPNTDFLLSYPVTVANYNDESISGYADVYEIVAGNTYNNGRQIPAGAKAVLVYTIIDDSYPSASSNEWTYKWDADAVSKRFMIANGADEQSMLSWIPLDSNGKLKMSIVSSRSDNKYQKAQLQIHGYRL